MFKETKNLVSESSPPVLVGLMWFIFIVIMLSVVFTGIYWFTAPANVAIENRTFHQSQAYTDGMARDLENMRSDYLTASPESQAVIRATIQHRYAGYDASTLPADLRSFLSEMKQ